MIIRIRRRGNAGAGIGAMGRRTFKRQYLIQSDIPNELRSGILAYPTLPKYGAPHPEDFTCTCSEIELEQMEEDPFWWRLDAKWETLHGNGRNEKEDQKQPDQRRAQWSSRFTPLANTALPKDLQGKAFCDSAGSPFNPPPEMPIWCHEITIVRWEKTWNDSRDMGAMYSTNTDVWRNSQPKEALVANITKREVWEQNAYWFEYTWQILQNPKISLPNAGGTIGGWDPHLVNDYGPRNKNTAGQLVANSDDNGVPDGQPRYLDGTGKLLAPQNDGSYKPFALQFQIKKFSHFGDFNLTAPWDS